MPTPLPFNRASNAYTLPPPNYSEHNPTAAGIGILWPILLVVPYGLAMGLQDSSIRAACIVGLAVSGGFCLLGLLLMLVQARRIWPYLFELALMGVFGVSLGLTYVNGGKWEQAVVWRSFTFIVNTALAVCALVSTVVRYPFTLQHLRESIPRSSWRNPSVRSAAYWTTGVWVMAFTASSLLYLIPVAAQREYITSDSLNAAFRVAVPIVLFLLADLFMFLFPHRIIAHLVASHGFDTANSTKVNQSGQNYIQAFSPR